MEDEERKTRKDFDTDSDYYTYMITHPEDEIEDEEEKEKEPDYVYYKCSNPKCDFVMKSNVKIPADKMQEVKDMLLDEQCPKCGKRGFVIIDKDEYTKLDKKKKEKEKQEKIKHNRMVDITIKKIKDDISDLQKELEEALLKEEITPKRFSALMYNLTFNIFRYYTRRNDKMDISWSDFSRLARSISEDILYKYDVKESLDDILEGYKKDEDILYLTKSRKIAEESKVGKSEQEIEEIDDEIRRLDNIIKYHEENSDRINSIEDRRKEKSITKTVEEFKNSLKKDNKI